MNIRSTITFASATLVSSFAYCAVPEVSDVTMTQDASRLVTITYQLANAPAVVTLDIETNGVSIGGANIDCLSGDVNKIVTGNGLHTLTWRPDKSWPDHKIKEKICQAAVTAWALDNPPDYAVIDLVEKSDCRWRFYPAVEFLPGGILGNTAYRTSKLVMRKIHAKNVSWTMGSIANGTAHGVTMTDDYYIGVFELTQAQWACIPVEKETRKPYFNVEGAMRPMETGILYYIALGQRKAAYYPPNPPHSDCYIGKLTTRAENIATFSIPSEAQWEFACRAGHGEGYYGNGLAETEANMQLVSRCAKNGGSGAQQTDGPERGTAICGSYAPNDWGLYDMIGNVSEFCYDWWKDDITDNHDGHIEMSGTDSNPDVKHVRRGGGYWNGIEQCNSWCREQGDDNYGAKSNGYRLSCSATLTAPAN